MFNFPYFPGTNLNDLNLDWIVRTIKKLENASSVSALPIIADDYSTDKTYNAGDLVIYDNKLYRANVDITDSESFDSTKWDETTIAELLNTIEAVVSTSTVINDSILPGETVNNLISYFYDRFINAMLNSADFNGETIEATILNGSENSPNSTTPVHTDFVNVSYGDVVSIQINKPVKVSGDFYVFGISTRNSNLADRIRYIDYGRTSAYRAYSKIQIILPAEEKISFTIAESNGARYTQLRSTDFETGDVVIKKQKFPVLLDSEFFESFINTSQSAGAEITPAAPRIKLMSYNIASYKCDTTQFISDSRLQKLRNFIQSEDIDIAGLQENVYYIDGSSKGCQNYCFYPYFHDWYYTFSASYAQVIFSRKTRKSGGANSCKVVFSNATGQNRAVQAVVFTYGSYDLLVCAFHGIWNDLGGGAGDTINVEGRYTQYSELLDWIDGNTTLKSLSDLSTDVSCPTHTHVAILGDFNTYTNTDKTNLQGLASAHNMKLCNGGSFGWVKTDRSANGQFALDNIILSSNIGICSFRAAWDRYGELYSDHVPLIAEVALL